MSWTARYPAERAAAEHALGAAAGTIAANLSTFTSWLMAAGGAAFALLLANLDKLSPHVDLRAFKWALIWFACSLLAGLLSRWLANSVLTTLSVIGSIRQRASEVGPIDGFSALAFSRFFALASLPGYRWFAWRGYRVSQSAEAPLVVRSAVRLSQVQSLLVLIQVALVVLSIVVLALGVKA